MDDRNINIASLILQLLSLDLISKDFNNSDLMKELQHQDANYFERIIKNQEEILTLLRKEEK
jgi:hypothetical protein